MRIRFPGRRQVTRLGLALVTVLAASMTSAERAFRPAFAVPLAGGAVVVDDMQPVAVFVDAGGAWSPPVSWKHLPRPVNTAWLLRTLLSADDAVYVRDEPDGPVVRITVADGALDVAERVEVPGTATVYERASFISRRSRLRLPSGRMIGWRSRLYGGTRWEASVVVDPDGEPGVHELGHGSITGSAVIGESVILCVRRATKRPWTFHPSFDLALVPGDGGATTVRSGAELPISDLCWDRGQVRVGAVLADYVPFVVAECAHARDAGAEDVRFEVRDLVDGPVVEISFRLGGRVHVRTDEPLDELGRPWGLRALTILLAEDLNSSVEWERDAEGRALL